MLDTVTGALGRDRVMTASFDVRDKASAVAWVEATARRFGRIDGLGNDVRIGST